MVTHSKVNPFLPESQPSGHLERTTPRHNSFYLRAKWQNLLLPKLLCTRKYWKLSLNHRFIPSLCSLHLQKIIWNAKQKHTQRHLPQQCLTTKPQPLARTNSMLSKKHLQAPFMFLSFSLSLPQQKIIIIYYFLTLYQTFVKELSACSTFTFQIRSYLKRNWEYVSDCELPRL